MTQPVTFDDRVCANCKHADITEPHWIGRCIHPKGIWDCPIVAHGSCDFFERKDNGTRANQ